MITDPKESRLLAAAVNQNDLSAEEKLEISRTSIAASSIKDLPKWVQDLASKAHPLSR